MKLFKTKRWNPVNIGCFKWANILFGMIIGAYCAEFVKEYVWIFVATVVILSIKILIFYFYNDRDVVETE